ncbi:hypothetical protein HGM15179_000189 [Zosterops borbonicus]|uniref:Uncharacterized protein n=1 Tax=Zosterops borbonicus TaxID=364589 RepID=A0A8K1GZD3_9PASS|nr:hypothetical protein HGM15179_000189 [Zosterops borbonicus]
MKCYNPIWQTETASLVQVLKSLKASIKPWMDVTEIKNILKKIMMSLKTIMGQRNVINLNFENQKDSDEQDLE